MANLPLGWSLAEWKRKRYQTPKKVEQAAPRIDANSRFQAMLDFWIKAIPTLDLWKQLRPSRALQEGLKESFYFPGFVPAYISPLIFAAASAHFVGGSIVSWWSGKIFTKTDQKVKQLYCPWNNDHLHQWLDMQRKRIAIQGCQRICWVGLGDRHRRGISF